MIAKNKISTATLIKIGLLSAISYIIMRFEIVIPIFVNFLKLDFSDIPALVGAMMLGPLAGIFIELIKNLLHLVIEPKTGGVGELANFIVGIAYIIPVGIIFKHVKNTKGFMLGAVAGILVMAVTAGVFNYFILIPAYAAIYGAPIETFVEMANEINSNVTDFKSMILFAIVPFNLFKGTIISICGYFFYKALKPLFFS